MDIIVNLNHGSGEFPFNEWDNIENKRAVVYLHFNRTRGFW